MKKKPKEPHMYHKRSKQIFFLFCMSFIMTVISLLFSIYDKNNFGIYIIVLAVFGTLCFLAAAMLSLQTVRVYRKANFGMPGISEPDPNRLRLFYKLMNENLFEYHFQPIINAKTGEIFAYEALMRTNENIGMLPNEILDLAAREKLLYELEKHTFFNVIKIMKANSDIFQVKKLFINSISSHILNEEDFNTLYNEYHPFFKNIVMEIMEAQHLNDSGLKKIKDRVLKANCQLALDDYGTGYSNESNLLKTTPNYIKIDRTLVNYIHMDNKKQLLLSNIVNFANSNGIKTIAEGIESYEEFEYVIAHGIDYIQGFYTAKPSPFLLNALPDTYLDVIKTLNEKLNLEQRSKRIYELSSIPVLPLNQITNEQYTQIIILDKVQTLEGSPDTILDTTLYIPDNSKCHVYLKNINLRGNDHPVISLGYNCEVTINLSGDNFIHQNGIRVPESSKLSIVGDGNLSINSDLNNGLGVGIGGNSVQSYGDITIDISGHISIINRRGLCIGIGGALNSSDAMIRLLSGHISIEVNGRQALGIGSAYGNSLITIGRCDISIIAVASYAIGIGSLKGYCNIDTCSNLNLKCEGRNSIAIGSFDKGEGNVLIRGGIIRIHYNTHIGVGIGAIGGNINIEIADGDINIYAEGIEVVGIGDYSGHGLIKINNGTIATELYSTHPLSIGNKDGIVVINGGNIRCELPEDIKPVNAFGVPLEALVLPYESPFEKNITASGYSYVYPAGTSEYYHDIRAYFPRDYEV